MKSFASLVALSVFAAVSAHADTNIALNTNGGVAIFGFNNTGNSAVLGTLYDHAGSSTYLNDGTYPGGGSDDTFGQTNPSLGFIGATFTLAPSTQVNSVVFYGSLFGDGGWFGANGVGPQGANSTLTAANLIAPTVQYTLNGGTSWINDTNVTNDYVSQMTGVYAGGASTTPPTTFTLTTPLTGIDGIRLIGQDGGYASNGGGFLGGHEIQVFSSAAVPEPSTWAMLFGGVLFLGWMGRFRALRK